jgi:hypothetical protein
MPTTETANHQPIGLDVGSSRIVAARTVDKQYQYDSQLNAFLTVPFSRLAASLLDRENVFHEIQGSEILLTSDDARRFAEVFHVGIRRPMLNGVLNPQEPHSLAVIRRILTRLLGKPAAAGQKVFYSVPAPSVSGEDGVAFHRASMGQILTEMGFHPTAFEEGLAVVFGELAASNFTGIGISCGSGMCNVCLAVLSMPVITFSVSKAGDFIDSQAALVTGSLSDQMRLRKEQSFYLNGLSGDRTHNALTVYYQEMITNLVDTLRTQISAARRLPKLDKPVPLVLSGGTAMPPGFLESFETALRSSEFPVKLSEVRVAADPLNSTARGALMAALC